MKGIAPFLVFACWVAAPVMAEFPTLRPMPRPVYSAPAAPVPGQTADAQPQLAVAEPGAGMFRSIRPEPRPDIRAIAGQAPKKGLLRSLLGPKKSVAKKPAEQAPKRYSSSNICNDSAIQGTAIPTIRGAQEGCGIEAPVRITAVDGVTLTMPATLDCDTARALRKWVTNKVKPAFGRNEVTSLRVAAHYACRGRNNKKGARISQHGRGKAIDISGFKLADGSEVTVLQDYKSRRGKAIRTAHKGACGIFGTTLGPGSDGYHQDHLHLDTASYRGGPYCK